MHKYIRADAVRVTDKDALPEFVECRIIDAAGREHLFHEKGPVVGLDWTFDDDAVFPTLAWIGCTIIGRRVAADGREVVEVDTAKPWGIESLEELTRFEVFADQIEDDEQTRRPSG